MDSQFIILAQVAPAVTTETLLFAVKSTEKALAQEISVCNRSGSPASFRISVSLLGAPTQTKDYLYYDCPISGNDTFATELELTLGSLDVIRVYASTANLTFTLIGSKT